MANIDLRLVDADELKRRVDGYLSRLKDVGFLDMHGVFVEDSKIFMRAYAPRAEERVTLKVLIDPWNLHVAQWVSATEFRLRDEKVYMSWLHRVLYDLAWPSYECGDCLGLGSEHGCNCDWYEAEAPGVPCSEWRKYARRLWSVVAKRCGVHDPGRR